MYVQRYDFFPNQPRDSWKKSSHKSDNSFKAILSVRNSGFGPGFPIRPYRLQTIWLTSVVLLDDYSHPSGRLKSSKWMT